jgi:tetratricopeptide (TPR) repeat protein
LKQAPDDYAGLVMMTKCQMVREKYSEADRFVKKAKNVYPQEAQAYYLAGFVNMNQKQYDSAYEDFKTYEKILPGNPNITFYQGLSLEKMNQVSESADKYYRYIKVVNQGDKAKYAYQRLVQWGYIKK